MRVNLFLQIFMPSMLGVLSFSTESFGDVCPPGTHDEYKTEVGQCDECGHCNEFQVFAGCIQDPPPPPRTCATVFVDPNFGGASWTIGAETEADDISGAMYERRTWCGALRGYCRGHDRSWNKAISSVKVEPWCKLYTWTNFNFTGDYVQFLDSDPMIQNNDAISSFKCTCIATPWNGGFNILNALP